MAGYKRPFSRSELRQMARTKRRTFFWCAVAVFFAVAGVAGLIYLMNQSRPH